MNVILSPSIYSRWTPRRIRHTVILSEAKDLEILRRPAVSGTPQNDGYGSFFSSLLGPLLQ
jgi:hypothetical protein